MEIQILNKEGNVGVLRVTRRRGMMRFRYAGTEVACMPAASLASHLALFGRAGLQSMTWGDTQIDCGRGEVRITLRRETSDHLLSDGIRKELATLAARPG
ncbi:hypothetical protein Kisp01_70250 [Kineosporia sp. NBRC 101677]|uniref:hypothetical protein n=1 Tax=Kineosporia sp. NBRC 101677 TaxID=3032197 RepID=UPI0024A4961C|nr:hypothetical protein [Kineosporia sp. NBRC 101677]GLY20011.1 hypothetical protein Kisp01_70250 [Kineosporia sp. NBRC 101677]